MKKKLIMAVAATAICATVAVGGTLAYLNAQTEAITNQFTFTDSDKVSIELKEPTWDNGAFTGETSNIPEEELGKNKAQSIVPGRVIPKDPTVKNTSGTASYVAVTIAIVDDKGATVDLTDLATIDWSTEWTFNAGHTQAFCDAPVDGGAKTPAVFTNVTISGDATNETMKPFDIVVKAYAVQAEGFNDCTAALQSSFPDIFGAPTTP